MAQTLAQKLTSITTLFFLIAAVSLVAFISKVDSYEFETDAQNIRDLVLMQSSIRTNAGNDLNTTVADYVRTITPSLTTLETNTRHVVMTQFNKLQVPPDALSCGDGQLCPNLIPPPSIGCTYEPEANDNQTISDLLLVYNSIKATCKVIMIKSVKADSMTPTSFDKYSFERSWLDLANKKAVFLFTPNDPDAGKNIKVFFTIDTLEFSPDLSKVFKVQDLENGHDEIAHMGQIYGHLDPKSAEDFLGEEIGRAYKDVSILGFTVSTHWYPFAICFAYLGAVLSLISVLRLAREKSIHLFLFKDDDGDIADAALRAPLLRILLWVALPALSTWAALPFIDHMQQVALNPYEGIALALLVLVVMMLGIRAVQLASQLTAVTHWWKEHDEYLPFDDSLSSPKIST